MDMQIFFDKFKILFHQWKTEEQDKYIDDLLLPKMTDIIETMYFKNGDPLDFLGKTEFLSLCDFYFTNFMSSSKVNAEILTFQIRALGIFSSSETTFFYVGKHSTVLPLLSNICNKGFISYDFSIQSSLLFFFGNLLEHSSGLNWILQIEGIIAKVFKTFESASFHVREDAINLLSNLFIKWYSEDLKDDSIIKAFDFLIQSVVLPSLKNHDVNSSVQNCTISLLSSYLKNSKKLRYLLCETYQLLENLIQSVKSIVENCRSLNDFWTIEMCPEAIILLIADCYTFSQSNNAEAIDNFLEFLFQSPLMPSAMLLVTSLLTRRNEDSNISRSQFNIVLWPFLKCLKMPVDAHMIPQKYQARLDNMVSNSKEQSLVLKTSLTCCKRILCSKNSNVSEQIIEIITTFLTSLVSHEDYAEEWLCSTKRLTVFVIDLVNLSTVINHFEFLKCNDELISKLFIGLLCVFKVSQDPHILASSFTAIRKYMDGTGLWFMSFKEISEILVKELCNSHSSVIEGCLDIIYHLVVKCTDLQMPWIHFLCSNKIFGVIWNIARDEMAESCLRAEAIKVLHGFNKNSYMWCELLKLNAINDDSFIKFILKLAKSNDDTLTKAMLSIFPHLLLTCSADSNHRYTMYSILCKILRISSDHECQVLALHIWQLVADTIIASVSEKSDKILAYKIMQALTQNGYCSSLLDAMHEENLVVRGEALQILLHLRQTMVNLGIIEESFTSNIFDVDEASCSELQNNTNQCSTFNEKSTAIDYVLNVSTCDTIKNHLVFRNVIELLKPEDYVISESFETSKEYTFWKYLWLDKLQEKLAFCNESCDPYEKNPISLLDDIIAAKRETYELNENYLSIDCY